MRLSAILATAIVAVSGSPVASPDVEGLWTISKFSFCRGDNTYNYSFNIKGTANGKTPAFSGTCAGTNGKVYLLCDFTPPAGANLNVFAETVIKNGNPEVSLMTWHVQDGCRYTGKGSIIIDDATCASNSGDKYRIAPANSKLCN